MPKETPEKTRPPDLDSFVASIDELSTLPQVFKQILEVTADPNTGAADLQNILKADPALTGKLLKASNSAYYGLTQKVVNVKNAIVFLGFKTVKNLAVAASVCDLFKSGKKIKNYSRESLWKHSVVVAICAKSIAQRTGLKTGEDLFTAGVMHDIGIIIEDQYLHDQWHSIMESSDLNDSGLINAEISVLGFDHAALGEALTRQWKIPPEITKLIAFHHKPGTAPEHHKNNVSILYLADTLCSAKKIGFVTAQTINRKELVSAMETLNFSKEDVSIILEELPGEIEKARELLIM